MKIVDIRSMKDADIEKKLTESKKELFNLRFQGTSGQLTNTARVRQVKRSVAKLLTVLSERANKAGEKNA